MVESAEPVLMGGVLVWFSPDSRMKGYDQLLGELFFYITGARDRLIYRLENGIPEAGKPTRRDQATRAQESGAAGWWRSLFGGRNGSAKSRTH
jgi:hypothetical protein